MSSQFCDMLDIRMVYKLRARHYFCTNANLKIVVTIIFCIQCTKSLAILVKFFQPYIRGNKQRQ
jgi:hypothetical protein